METMITLMFIMICGPALIWVACNLLGFGAGVVIGTAKHLNETKQIFIKNERAALRQERFNAHLLNNWKTGSREPFKE